MANITPTSPDTAVASGSNDWTTAAVASSSTVPTSSEGSDTSTFASNANYFLVFVILGLLIIAIFIIFNWRRKRLLERLRNARHEDSNPATGPREELDAWERNRADRHSRFDRRRSDEIAHEEGLNERGEAPPPYVPRQRDHIGIEMPAVPLRTLSRGQAGLKPPDYCP